MTTPNLASVLVEFHRDKLALRERHVAVARVVDSYEFNNTYQYIIAREDVHLAWLEAAIAELGATPDTVPEPEISTSRARKVDFAPLIAADALGAGACVDRWRPRTDQVGNARHRKMMGVVLGETLEHKRFFDQMSAGLVGVLGRRSNGPGSDGTGDGVLPVRWLE